MSQPTERYNRFDMSLPGSVEQTGSRAYQPSQAVLKANKHRRLKRSIAGGIALFLLVAGGFGAQSWYKLNKSFNGKAQTAAALNVEVDKVDPNALKGEGDGRINILLLGKGGAARQNADLTDSITLASIDPVNKKAALLNIPRDMWVAVPGGNPTKLNTIYSNAKSEALKQNKADVSGAETTSLNAMELAVGTVTGVPIHYYAMLDMAGFKQAVDAVGGITVNAPNELFDLSMAWENGGNPVLASKGAQAMDGKKALQYIRSYKTSSEHDRTDRQRIVIEALQTKAFSAGTLTDPTKLSALITAFGDHFKSDMSLKDAKRLAKLVQDIGLKNISSIELSATPNKLVRTDSVNRQPIVRPLAGYDNYTEIHAFVRNQLRDGYLARENASLLVLNGSRRDAKAGESKAAELSSYGYTVAKTGTIDGDFKGVTLVDLSGGKDRYTRHYLETRLNTDALNELPTGSNVETNGARFVIIVGD